MYGILESIKGEVGCFYGLPPQNPQSCHTGFGANFSIIELGLTQALLSEEKAAPGSQWGAVGERRIFP